MFGRIAINSTKLHTYNGIQMKMHFVGWRKKKQTQKNRIWIQQKYWYTYKHVCVCMCFVHWVHPNKYEIMQNEKIVNLTNKRRRQRQMYKKMAFGLAATKTTTKLINKCKNMQQASLAVKHTESVYKKPALMNSTTNAQKLMNKKKTREREREKGERRKKRENSRNNKWQNIVCTKICDERLSWALNFRSCICFVEFLFSFWVTAAAAAAVVVGWLVFSSFFYSRWFAKSE